VFNLLLYRLMGRPETHRAIGFQHVADFDPRTISRRVREHAARTGIPIFTAAYMVSGYTSFGSHDKLENVLNLFARLAAGFPAFERALFSAPSAEAAFRVLRAIDGIGDFLAYQALVDLLYPLVANDGRPFLPFSHDDWAMPGPGARRGIALLRDPGSPGSDLDLMRGLRDTQRDTFARRGIDFPYLIVDGAEREISLANIQNCLCEFHKYVKIANGTGRARRRFVSGEGVPPEARSADRMPSGRSSPAAISVRSQDRTRSWRR
jgi:hypothetical protein